MEVVNFFHSGGEGELGKIIILSDVENESYVSPQSCVVNDWLLLTERFMLQRSMAEVEWTKTGFITTCRLGQDGKVTSSTMYYD